MLAPDATVTTLQSQVGATRDQDSEPSLLQTQGNVRYDPNTHSLYDEVLLIRPARTQPYPTCWSLGEVEYRWHIIELQPSAAGVPGNTAFSWLAATT